jgi:hypothetical protein
MSDNQDNTEQNKPVIDIYFAVVDSTKEESSLHVSLKINQQPIVLSEDKHQCFVLSFCIQETLFSNAYLKACRRAANKLLDFLSEEQFDTGIFNFHNGKVLIVAGSACEEAYFKTVPKSLNPVQKMCWQMQTRILLRLVFRSPNGTFKKIIA